MVRAKKLQKQTVSKQKHGFQKGNKHGNRFKPGKSGNPGGRPKNFGITRYIREEMKKTGKDGKEVAQQLAEILVLKAMGGDFQFMKEALERTDGKVSDKLEVKEVVDGWDQEHEIEENPEASPPAEQVPEE